MKSCIIVFVCGNDNWTIELEYSLVFQGSVSPALDPIGKKCFWQTPFNNQFQYA